MDIIKRLDEGYAWTGDRIAVVRPEHLDRTTPCTAWDLRQLLNHLLGSLDMLTAGAAGHAVDGAAQAAAMGEPHEAYADLIGDDCGRSAFARVREQARAAWDAPDVLERILEIPLGPTPAPFVANITLLEVVVHGWDISQASGEAAAIPPELAEPVLEFARLPVVDGQRGTAFGPATDDGSTASGRLVAFLGRTP